MENALVSIIVPLYNCEKYIDRCIYSVLNQTHKSIELIIVNDGSTDASASIVKSYKDSRIKYLEQQNKGPSAARNHGLDEAKGNYIMFLDSDDEYESFFVEDLYKALTFFDSDIAVGQCRRKNKNWITPLVVIKEKKVTVDIQMLLSDRAETHCICMYKTFSIKNIRYEPNINYSEDWLFYKMALLNSKSICYVNSPGYLYWDNDVESLAWSKYNYNNHVAKAHASIYAHLKYATELYHRKIKGDKFVYQSCNILIGYFYGLYKNKMSYNIKDFKKEYREIKPYLIKIITIKGLLYRIIMAQPRIAFVILKITKK